MAEITTMPTAAVCQDVGRVAIEDDASPVVRLVGRTLRDAIRSGRAHEALSHFAGTVVIRSHDTPQAATIVLRNGFFEVTSLVQAEPDATVVVDLHGRFAPTQEPMGDSALAAATLRALSPPLPPWREAAGRFWEVTRGIPGVPEVLVVVSDGPDGLEREQFGHGSTEYLLAGPPDLLAAVLSGADDFVRALSAGLRVRGTLAQLSVMTAAFWKLRFDV